MILVELVGDSTYSMSYPMIFSGFTTLFSSSCFTLVLSDLISYLVFLKYSHLEELHKIQSIYC